MGSSLYVKARKAQENKQKESVLPSAIKIHLDELEKDLSGSMGRKVKIAHKGKKGKIELEYYNSDDLEILLQALKKLGGKESSTHE